MRFSIIIPTYNRALFLPKAIDSVLAQTYTDWELIIVDDGSTDNTKDVVSKYKDDRIRYFYQQNAERCTARNNGIKQSSGKYICFLDSDDSYRSNYLETVYGLILNCEDAVFVLSGMSVHRNEKVVEVIPEAIGYNRFHYFFQKSVPPSVVCLSRSLLKNHSFDEGVVVSEDTKLWVEIMRENPIVLLNKTVGVDFYFHESNTINVKKRNVYAEREKTLRQILVEDVNGNINKRFATYVMDDCTFGMVRFYLYQSQKLKAIFVLLKSIVFVPTNRLREKLGSLRNVLLKNTL